ncbi:MAG: STAS domain-containing protein [Leptospiraceae bacterium]|nr:STAS domain-containing protein [Leptospiraceae bacterium]MDW8306838.1 STAS domain-containing protein [Leptospiraceae bacterium]
MEIKTRNRKAALEIIPIGKLDILKAEQFETDLQEKIRATTEKVIGINLAKVEYIDSSGLGALIKVLKASQNAGKTLLLFGVSPKIQNIFQLARLEKFFTFTTPLDFNTKYPSPEDEEMDEFLKKL